MKKTILIIVLIIIVLMFNYSRHHDKKNTEIRGVFVSYIELSEYIKNKSYSEGRNSAIKIINNIKSINCNTIILQVRVGCDAIYNSNIYPTSRYIVDREGDSFYDVLDLFIKEAHKRGVKVVAWINPYRVRTTSDIDSISTKSPIYKYLNSDIIYINNGIYMNPSKRKTVDLIVKGVREVLKYKIDGVLFDDYFYPNSEIDEEDYKNYLREHEYISGEEYRLGVVNNMIKKVHGECKKKGIKFGISPDGNIDNNYHKNYADTSKWMSSSEYIDFIMPQIYYGFYNSKRDYVKTSYEWEMLNKSNIDYYVALAFYKVGMTDKFADKGFNEWVLNDDIIMREIIISRNIKNYKGFSLFRYDNIFNKDIYTKNTKSELENMKKVLK